MVSCSKDDSPAPVIKAEVTIGTQVWATKNLDVATYSDGTVIPQVTKPVLWENLRTGAWCYYEHSTANGTIYGKLYNWYAVAGIHDNDPNTPNKVLAPTGWHVPSNAEWNTLIDFLGGASVAGDKMKATGTTLWQSPNADATNSSCFNGLPGGYSAHDQKFIFLRLGGYWWSSSEGQDIYEAFFVQLASCSSSNINCSVTNIPFSKRNGFSVRLIKD